MTDKPIGQVKLPGVRISYPKLFTPEGFQGSDSNKAYSASFIIPKDTKLGMATIARLKEAIKEVKDAKWPKKAPDLTGKVFWEDGDQDEKEREEYARSLIVRARNPKRPTVVDAEKNPVTDEDRLVYGGRRVNAVITIWAQDNKYGKRLNCTLEAVQVLEGGDPFGAAPVSADAFDDEEFPDDDFETSDSGLEDDDEIPF